MNTKEFDYMQVLGLTDHRPFIVPGLLNWLMATAGRTFITFITDFPGVEGTQGLTPTKGTYATAVQVNGEWVQGSREISIINFEFTPTAISNFFANDQGVGCMMRFNQIARSVFIPYASMLAVYKPDGMEGGNILGYEKLVGQRLLNAITPGMIEAMDGKAPEVESTPPPANEEPKTKPTHLQRVK